ncbi:hypothetical protein PR003_g2885 [Phytophthora rubi]|uniref:BRCT domain-containing protein n=1 Tax=Phytophthora rubi TaxID=129364 RepID=A0A6A3P2Q6_9STRA|nr:hypothetical protein PR002_g1068 [Phytophthora rubi]KAE9052014.1 hypothetical protein PR001_g897 [Phytophthora rubi]KAE9355361.1 hypothetical protein PR003_g2885 [Phytophthora rubi]
MREQWEAAQACLRVFLDEDSDYVQFLASIEQSLARKLRFESRLRGGSLVDSVDFDRFVETAARLRYFHELFQVKLKPFTDPPARGDVSPVDGKCSIFVETLADMLSVLRVFYGQLFCRVESTQAVIDNALASQDNEWDGILLQDFLAKQQLTAEKLVTRPLKRFDELVEFVEALSKTLSEDGGSEVTSDNSDSDCDEKLNYAPQLMHIAQENKHYIHVAKADAREEKELIALQTCFHGDGADALGDLSNKKLLLHGEVYLSVLSARNDNSGVDEEATSQPETIYAHCFEDGTLVCSNRRDTESETVFPIQQCLHLKQDAAFLEFIPASVPMLEPSGEGRALALIRQETTLVLAWNDAAASQRWADGIGGFLEMNGSRNDVLRQGRSIGDLPVPEEITAQLGKEDPPPTEFVSFYDDLLPGVFWLAPGKDSNPSEEQWQMVEIVFYAKWLLIFKLDGWKGHSLLCKFDTRTPGMEIGEHPRGDKEWSLVISHGSAPSLTLVSKKRTRIDFWFDQVWKAIGSAQVAVQREESERRERKQMEEEEAYARGNGSRKPSEQTGKKRKLVASPNEQLAEKAQEPPSTSSSAASTGSKPDDKTDEECGELEKRSTANCTKEEHATALPAKKKPRRSSDRSKKTSSTGPTATDSKFGDVASPPVKTPKRRWLMRKSDDPNDTDLIPTQPTQPSPCIPTYESTSEIDTTQLPGNEAQVEVESKSQEVRVILTGIEPTASIRKKIDSISGAVYEEDIEKATHVLAPKNQLKRTVKLLCGISRCAHVLDVRWLDESARVGAPIYERAHCLKDAKAEAKWQFDLRKTMYEFTPEQRRQLFVGHKVFITNHKSILPPVKDLVKIVECAGGTAVTKGSAGPNDVVITSEAALGTASVRKALMQANPQRIYSAELILSSILQQHIDFDKNRLEQLGGGSRRRR